MPKHKTQRVGIFVDVQNLYYSAKQFYNSKVNFAYILNKAIAGRELVRAIAYVIKADIKDEHNFFDALEKIGFDVRSKDLQTFYTGAKKGDWDVGIAMDIMRMAHKLDVVVLVSGDGDFKDLLEHVKALGCRAEVVSFAKTTSARLTEVADDVLDLGKDLDKVLIKDHRHRMEVKTELPPQTDGPVTDNLVLPTEVLLNEGMPDKPKEFGNKNGFQKQPFKKPFPQRPFQNDRFKKPFNRFQRGDRPDRNDRDRGERDDMTNILQKINMDQPLLAPKPAALPPRIAPMPQGGPKQVVAEPRNEEKHAPKQFVAEAPKTEEKTQLKKAAGKPKVMKKKPVREPKAKAERTSEKSEEDQKKESFAERIFGKKKKVE
jgi:uncharacterized LabA/DUF88 family protein